MDKVAAIFEGIGILATAYALSYPVHKVITRPLDWVNRKVIGNVWFHELLAEMDALRGAPFPKVFGRNKP